MTLSNLKPKRRPSSESMVPGPDGFPLSATCPDCNRRVRAVDGEMAKADMRAFRLGRRPVYALHADCRLAVRR